MRKEKEKIGAPKETTMTDKIAVEKVPGWVAENELAVKMGWMPCVDTIRDNNPGSEWSYFRKGKQKVWLGGYETYGDPKWVKETINGDGVPTASAKYSNLAEALTEPKFCFEVGKKYTIYKVSENMAINVPNKILVKAINGRGDPEFVLPGKRTRNTFKMVYRRYVSAPIDFWAGAVFEGWDLPFTAEMDQPEKLSSTGMMCRKFKGDACYNFVGDPVVIRNYFEWKQLNPVYTEENLGRTVAVDADDNDNETPVFPEKYVPGECAPMDRKMETWKAKGK